MSRPAPLSTHPAQPPTAHHAASPLPPAQLCVPHGPLALARPGLLGERLHQRARTQRQPHSRRAQASAGGAAAAGGHAPACTGACGWESVGAGTLFTHSRSAIPRGRPPYPSSLDLLSDLLKPWTRPHPPPHAPTRPHRPRSHSSSATPKRTRSAWRRSPRGWPRRRRAGYRPLKPLQRPTRCLQPRQWRLTAPRRPRQRRRPRAQQRKRRRGQRPWRWMAAPRRRLRLRQTGRRASG